jgi:hypothetical protein
MQKITAKSTETSDRLTGIVGISAHADELSRPLPLQGIA